MKVHIKHTRKKLPPSQVSVLGEIFRNVAKGVVFLDTLNAIMSELFRSQSPPRLQSAGNQVPEARVREIIERPFCNGSQNTKLGVRWI